MPYSFEIGPHVVGGGAPPLFMAELGALFGQDVSAALVLIDAVAEAGAGEHKLPVMLKTEILHDIEVCLDDASVQTFKSKSGGTGSERYRDLVARKVLPLDAYARMFDRARSRNLSLCVSVYDDVGANFARDQGVALLKIASSNLTHLPLLRHVAGLGVPMMIDTGRASLAEVDTAVRVARLAGASRIILQHSQDGHPAPAENGNLRTLETYRRVFGVPVGLSDHFIGTQMLHVAIGIGVDVLERNIAIDPYRLDDDHAFSSGVAELEPLLSDLYASWRALGNSFRDPNNRHGLIATSGRMGLVTRRAIRVGETLGPDTIRFAFPNKGIGVEFHDLVSGATFLTDLPAGVPVAWKDLRLV